MGHNKHNAPKKNQYTIGRSSIPFRTVIDNIVYVIRTGCLNWKMLLPSELSSASTTCHMIFQQQWI